MIDRKKFYAKVRTKMFAGKLSTAQVENMEAILNEWDNRKLTDARQLAYILATVYHETGTTMAPIAEYGKGAGRSYGEKLRYGGGPGKRIPYTNPDQLYYGRGHTQNTWFEIYERLTIVAKLQGYQWDFLNHPQLLLLTQPSIWATFHGMTTGLYTGRKLSHYFNATKEDWIGARYIINGEDKAEKIALHAKSFYNSFN